MANKLSKAQQEVVEKMRKGCLIRNGVKICLVESDAKKVHNTILPATFKSLVKRDIIEYYNGNWPFSYYRLSEQYKNEQK